VPYPFSKGVFICGEPIYVKRRTGPEECEKIRRGLEDALNEITARADGFFNEGVA
jgi:lysophospholipid acyltransferase (LPLAT)-like uncharacterized protein